MMRPPSLDARERRRVVRVALACMALCGCARPATTSRSDELPVRAPPNWPPPVEEVDLAAAATADVHGRLRAWDYYTGVPERARGLTRAATIVDSLRRANPRRVVLVDAGDLLQGNPLTFVAARVAGDSLHPHPVAAAMNAMHYDAAAVGNHEFNYGLPTLRRMMRDAHFPMLAANAYAPDGRRAFDAWTMIERHGVKIALVGGTTPGSNLWDRDNLAGHVVVRDIVPSVRYAVEAARVAGADVVVVLLHSGLDEPSSYDTVATGLARENVTARVAREVQGIDLIVYGHSHKELGDSAIGGALLMQPKNWATSVAVAHLRIVRDGARWRVADKHSVLIPSGGHDENAALLAATDRAHRATIAYVSQPIGTTPVLWRADSARVVDTPLIDFILDVERKASGAQLASTAAFSLDANLPAGDVTVARLAALYPYDNTLRKIWITGRQLRDYLEFSARYFRSDAAGTVGIDPSIPGFNFDIVAGADYTIDVSKPVGARITRLEYQPRPDANGVMRGGLAYVAGAIERAERECVAPACTALLLDGGDEFQGTPASNFAFGRPVVDVFNRLGLAAAALGNHEFDWGQDTLRARMRQAHYPILGANVRDTLGRHVPWIPGDTLIVRGGIKVGIIGVATRGTATSTKASNVVGLRFETAAPIVDSLTRQLRADGAEVVVVIAHAGAFCDRTGESGCAGEIVDLAQHVTQRVDAIISGHTHSLVNSIVNGIPIVQGRSRGEAIDVIDLPIHTQAGGTPGHEVREVLPDSITADADNQAIVTAAKPAVAQRVSRPIARIAEYMKKSPAGAEEQVALGNLIADAMRVEGKGDIGMMNNGGIRAPLRAGTATYGDLFEVQPFGNILYRVTLDGPALRAYVEKLVGRRRPIVHISGMLVQYDSTRAPRARALSGHVDGAPLNDARSYTVVVNDFQYTGGSGLGFDTVRRAENLDLVDLDAFVDYLQGLPQPVAAPTDKRFVIALAP